MKKIVLQIIKFGGVGLLCFIIDFSIMTILHELLSLNIIIACGLAFTISTVVNYILSVRYVFDVSALNSHVKNLILFVIFSVSGLVITEFLMYIGVNLLTINYMFVKILSTGTVMVFNFITRKLFLERL